MDDATKSEVSQPENPPKRKQDGIPAAPSASILESSIYAKDVLRAGTASQTEVSSEQADTVSHDDPAEEEHPEWEVDSSPIESSSDDSSSDDSSSEDSDEEGENSYKLLSPEEQAKILMAGDGGSDDEGDKQGVKGPGGQLRTKNEIPEEVIPKPNVEITTEYEY